MPHSQVRQRTVMASGATSVFNCGRLSLWAATRHGDRESHILRPWTSSTRHGDRNPHKKLSQFVSHCNSDLEAERQVPSHGKDTSWKSRPVDKSILRVVLAKKVAVHPWQTAGTSTKLVEFDSQFGRILRELLFFFCLDARLRTHMCNFQRGPRGLDDVLTAVDSACFFANFWYAASTYSMEHRPTRTCSKKTHAQRHGTLVVYAQVSSNSGQRKRPRSQTAISLLPVHLDDLASSSLRSAEGGRNCKDLVTARSVSARSRPKVSGHSTTSIWALATQISRSRRSRQMFQAFGLSSLLCPHDLLDQICCAGHTRRKAHVDDFL